MLRIPDPDIYPFRIPNPKTAEKERGEKKFVVKPFLVATNFTNLKLFYFLNAEEKNVGQFSTNYRRNYRTFYTKNLSLSSKKYGVGIRIRNTGLIVCLYAT
jgi:hypothetical protein